MLHITVKCNLFGFQLEQRTIEQTEKRTCLFIRLSLRRSYIVVVPYPLTQRHKPHSAVVAALFVSQSYNTAHVTVQQYGSQRLD